MDKKQPISSPKPAATAEMDLGVQIDLTAVLVAAAHGNPVVLTVGDGASLPSGPLESGHRSLQSAMRERVEQQTGQRLGYIEQLYTFADRDRSNKQQGRRVISISYLGLTREDPARATRSRYWRSWYEFFPWEDHRNGAPDMITQIIMPALRLWAEKASPDTQCLKCLKRWQRAAASFGFDGRPWNEELTLQRYELLYEAGLVEEAGRDLDHAELPLIPGRAMSGDYRRILATGIARLRTKIKYRPVVFELMPPDFTLLQLQRMVEALIGMNVHKQNFRRLIEQQDLVEETGQMSSDTGGRPAKLFHFRHEVLDEKSVAGTI